MERSGEVGKSLKWSKRLEWPKKLKMAQNQTQLSTKFAELWSLHSLRSWWNFQSSILPFWVVVVAVSVVDWAKSGLYDGLCISFVLGVVNAACGLWISFSVEATTDLWTGFPTCWSSPGFAVLAWLCLWANHCKICLGMADDEVGSAAKYWLNGLLGPAKF